MVPADSIRPVTPEDALRNLAAALIAYGHGGVFLQRRPGGKSNVEPLFVAPLVEREGR